MPQGEHIEQHQKRYGKRLDAEERARKKKARQPHKDAATMSSMHGRKAKLLHKQRYSEKVAMRKLLKQHDQRNVKTAPTSASENKDALPAYLLDREDQNQAKVLSSALKQRRKDKAAKYSVPLPKVRGIAEAEAFKVINTGKTGRKAWKRRVTKMTFVPESYTRANPKAERFIRPTGLRMRKANVTHPTLQTTFQLPIIGVKKNPSSPMYTQLGVLTKGTIIEVNVAELGLVTPGGKVSYGKYAQITNNPENDGCLNAVLLV